jgi:hypothetical protein
MELASLFSFTSCKASTNFRKDTFPLITDTSSAAPLQVPSMRVLALTDSCKQHTEINAKKF